MGLFFMHLSLYTHIRNTLHTLINERGKKKEKKERKKEEGGKGGS